MPVYRLSKDLKEHLGPLRSKGLSIGAVPTMGALHDGHASLVRSSLAENDVTVVSIFVNPRQFNDPNDLNNYPRDLERDTKFLNSIGDVVLYAPGPDDVYADHEDVEIDLQGLGSIMEGRSRPGHFNGVLQVVHSLFDIIQPDRAYFGEKDRQQLMVIQRMVDALDLKVQIRPCPTERDEHGLALSSRNALLSEEQKMTALILGRSLKKAISLSHQTFAELRATIESDFESTPDADLEYFEIIDLNTLGPITNIKPSMNAAAFIAAQVGSVRLIDNMLL